MNKRKMMNKTKNVKKNLPLKPATLPRTKAVTFLQNAKGRFVGCTWIKNDGTLATANGHVLDNGKPTNLGYVRIKDYNQGHIRTVNTRTIRSVSCGGKMIAVK